MTQDRSPVTSDRSDDDRTVVPFRPRTDTHGWGAKRSRPPVEDGRPPVEGLGHYEGGDADDSYRHRMLVNLAALIFTVALAGAGAWLALQIADIKQKQDCVLSGRRDCAPIDLKPSGIDGRVYGAQSDANLPQPG